MVNKRKACYKLELVPTLYALAWGLWLSCPFWDSFSTSQIFYFMGKLAPEWLWGVFYSLIAIFQIMAIIIGKPKYRLFGTIMLMFGFVSLTILAAVGNFKSTATPTYFVTALAAWFAHTEILASIKRKE